MKSPAEINSTYHVKGIFFGICTFFAIALIISITWLLAGKTCQAVSPHSIIAKFSLLVPPHLSLPIVEKCPENITYFASIFLGVPIIIGTALISLREYDTSKIHKANILTGIAFLILSIWILCKISWSNFLSQNSYFYITFSYYKTNLTNIIYPIASFVLSYIGIKYYDKEKYISKFIYIALTFFSICLVAWISSSVITTINDGITVSTHYEVFSNPIIQDFLGKILLVNQKTQYGLYPFFLRPIWLFFKPFPLVLTTVMAIILFISFLFLIFFLTHYFHNKPLALITSLTGIAFALFWYPMWPHDFYFQFFPLRIFFPSLACILTIIPTPTTATKRIIFFIFMYFILSMGIFWNFESGACGLTLYWLFTVLTNIKEFNISQLKVIIYHIALALLGFLCAFLIINLYYINRFDGLIPHWNNFILHLQLFTSGFYGLPIEKHGVWIIPIGIYCLTLFVGFREILKFPLDRKKNYIAAMIITAIFGLIILKYYENRSHPLLLAWVSFPAFFCLGFLSDLALQHRHEISIPILYKWPLVIILIFSACISVVIFDYANRAPLDNRGIQNIVRTNNHSGIIEKKIKTIITEYQKVRTASTDKIFVLSNYAYLVYLALNQPSLLSATGTCQIFFDSDLEDIINAVKNPNVKMIVTDFPDTPGSSCTGFLLPEEVKSLFHLNFYLVPITIFKDGKNFKIYFRQSK